MLIVIRKIIAVVLFASVFSAVHCQQYIDYLQLSRNDLNSEHFTKAIENLNIYVKSQPYMYEGYFFRAFAKYQLGDYIGSEHDYTHAISLFPFKADLFCYRAIARDRLFDYSGSLEDYQKAISLDSTDAEIYINRANTYLSLYRFNAAIEDCNQAERLKLKDDNLYAIRASAETGLKNYKEAIRDYTRAVKSNPENMNAFIQRGAAFLADTQKDSALRDYNHVLSIDSVNAFALFERAMVELDDSSFQEALNDLNRVIELSPGCAVALFNRAILYSNTNRYFDALNDYNSILTLDPGSILTYFNRAGLKYDHGDMKGALKDYDKAIELFPDFAKAYFYRSQVKKDMGNAKGAKADDEKAGEIEHAKSLLSDSTRYMEEIRLMNMTALPEDFSKPNDIKDRIQYNQVDIEPRSIYSQVLSLDTGERIKVYQPKAGQHHNTKALLLVNKSNGINEKEVLKKIELLDSVLSNNPRDTADYLQRAILFTSLQWYNQAFADYDKVIALDPANGLAYFNRANARFKYLELLHSFEGDDGQLHLDSVLQNNKNMHVSGELTYGMVVKDYTCAIQQDSNFTYAWYNRANVKFQMRDLSGAVKDLYIALACDSTLSEAYYNTGLLLILLSDIPHACEYLSKAGELGILESYNVIKRYCSRPKAE